MAIGDRLARTGPYVDRLFEDEYLRAQVGDALVRGRRAIRRARAQRAAQAVQDKTLLAHVTGALSSLQDAGRRLTGRPAPKPPPRRRRTVLLFALAVAAGAAAAKVSKAPPPAEATPAAPPAAERAPAVA